MIDRIRPQPSHDVLGDAREGDDVRTACAHAVIGLLIVIPLPRRALPPKFKLAVAVAVWIDRLAAAVLAPRFSPCLGREVRSAKDVGKIEAQALPSSSGRCADGSGGRVLVVIG